MVRIRSSQTTQTIKKKKRKIKNIPNQMSIMRLFVLLINIDFNELTILDDFLLRHFFLSRIANYHSENFVQCKINSFLLSENFVQCKINYFFALKNVWSFT